MMTLYCVQYYSPENFPGLLISTSYLGVHVVLTPN